MIPVKNYKNVYKFLKSHVQNTVDFISGQAAHYHYTHSAQYVGSVRFSALCQCVLKNANFTVIFDKGQILQTYSLLWPKKYAAENGLRR